MVRGKLPVPGRPTNLDFGRARAYWGCSRCCRGLLGHYNFSTFSISLGDGRISNEILLFTQNNQPTKNVPGKQ